MWTKNSDYQRFLTSIFLLIVVFVANSNQQKLISSKITSVAQLVNNQNATKTKEVIKNESNNFGERLDESTTTLPDRNSEEEPEKSGETDSITIRLKDVQNMLEDFLNEEKLEANDGPLQKRSTDQRAYVTDLLFNDKFVKRVKKFTEKYIFQAASGSALNHVLPTAGRVFLFKGFKKLMWPIFIGVQVAKTVLLAMFLPSIIGSIGKMVGKGLVSVSGFGHPTETVDDFEFKDNPPVVDEQSSGMGYNYPQQTLTANHNNAAFDAAPSGANNMLSLYDMADPKPQFSIANTYQLPEYAQNSRKETLQSKKDDFKVFHDIPASSMLLTNYDPFYSPLLSRLDAVFHQLNLQGDSETCREKLVCLMYASPAKYMPYSNLVSAQLSRELNELRKPTSDNVEILRFFKYMRSARDGQDGKNCHNIYKKCSSFTDTEQPAMLTTYNDINKLVQARKLH